MPLIPGMTAETASHICMHQCRAMCCRGPQYLTLKSDEVAPFRRHAAALGVALELREAPDGTGAVRFLDHEGDRCPMLDPRTWACRIYSDRPSRCREFPDRPRPGCAISGAE